MRVLPVVVIATLGFAPLAWGQSAPPPSPLQDGISATVSSLGMLLTNANIKIADLKAQLQTADAKLAKLTSKPEGPKPDHPTKSP